jgi:hypothetical protein
MLKIEYLEEEIPVYDITVEGTHNFFANDILVHNCQEITLPTEPLNHIDEEMPGEIALCILSAVNVGKVKSDEELEELCDLSVRGLEELIDYQEYPIRVAEVATKARRSLGVGFIGLAHYSLVWLTTWLNLVITTILRRRGMLFMVCQSHSSITYSSLQMKLLKRRDTVNTLAVPNILRVFFPSTPIRRMLMKLLHIFFNMIGRVLESRFWLTDYDTQHCPHRCLRRAVPLCQTQQMESSHLETICPLRRVRKDPLSRLYRLIKHLKTITHYSGK